MAELNPWDRLPKPERGARTKSELYTAVGASLSQWERTEESLAEIFSFFVGGDLLDMSPAIRAYGSVVSFSSRADMLDAAATAYFYRKPNTDVERQFGALLKQCRQFSGRRNDIAHGRVHAIPKLGCFLLPGLFNSRKIKIDGDPAYFWAIREIRHYRDYFSRLAGDLNEFVFDHSMFSQAEHEDLP